MIKNRQRVRTIKLLPVLMVTLVIAGGGITLVWMNTGFVECSGFLEPDSWVPLYAGSDGLVKKGALEDGMTVIQGERLLLLDDEWPKWNIRRIHRELNGLESEISAGERSLTLFSYHRDIEEEELRRIITADQLLFDNFSLTLNDLKHDEYLYHTFCAGADREQEALKQSISTDRQNLESLKTEQILWELRLKETRVLSPETGVFFSVETVLSGASAGMVPLIGPGRHIESGRLLGYIIPGRGMQAHIEIPQHRIDGCREGQRVLLSVDARPQWRYPPVEARLSSITNMASKGVFHAAVCLDVSEETLEDLKALGGGNITARIEIRQNRRFKLKVLERWSMALTSIGRKKNQLQ